MTPPSAIAHPITDRPARSAMWRVAVVAGAAASMIAQHVAMPPRQPCPGCPVAALLQG